MAYASLAGLPVQYGLYSSFMGVLVYWFFATSKDITIGVRLMILYSMFLLQYSSLIMLYSML
jgi:MFS superfamily sulfate permease-like transporter